MIGPGFARAVGARDAARIFTVVLVLLCMIGVLAIIIVADIGGRYAERSACEAKGGELIRLRQNAALCIEKSTLL